MSANILEKDTCVTLEPAWHGLEKIVKVISYETSGLDWTVEKQKLFLNNGREVEGFDGIYCPEKDELIHVTKDSYEIIQNDQIFEVIDDALQGVDYEIVSAGSLGNLKRVYVSVVIKDEQEYVVNKDKFKNYLTFATSHDGSLAFECYDTSLRVICSNTLQWSRRERGLLRLRVRHTKNNKFRIENMKEHLEKLFEKREEFYRDYQRLASKAMSVDEAEKILAGFVCNNGLSTRAKNQVDAMVSLFKNGRGNSGETQADLLNAVTEYYSVGASSNTRKLYSSSEFGSYSKKKFDFWSAIKDEELDALAEKGEKILNSEVELVGEWSAD